MTCSVLPLTDDQRQVFTIHVSIDGSPFQARVEVRYLPAPDQWVISIWDDATGELLVNMIPLICSSGSVNDLLRPFRYLWNGAGLGSLFVFRAVDVPDTQDPAANTLNQFTVLWSDTLPEKAAGFEYPVTVVSGS